MKKKVYTLFFELLSMFQIMMEILNYDGSIGNYLTGSDLSDVTLF